MMKSVKISNVNQIRTLVTSASKSLADIGVHDSFGAIADAKSILGMLNLDYSRPVSVVCENEKELSRVCSSLVQ